MTAGYITTYSVYKGDCFFLVNNDDEYNQIHIYSMPEKDNSDNMLQCTIGRWQPKGTKQQSNK